MINNTESKKVYEVQSGVTEYPIGFPFHFNADQTPQLSVVIGHDVLQLNYNCKLSEDKGTLILIPTEEEAEKLTGPDDYSWMDKWVGAHLVIERDIPFVQESDYQLGRISAEQIEHDFDASVMRDQMLADKIGEHTVDVQGEIDALHSRIDFVQEEHVLDMAAVDKVMATKATKTELENAKTTLNVGIHGNAQAIQKTRDDYQAADQNIRADMNAKDSELETILNSGLSDVQTQITAQAAAIAKKAEKDSVYTKEQVDAKVSSVYKVKGSVANYDSLPINANVGDVYDTLDSGANYVWTENGWDKLGDIVDLTDYAKKVDLDNYLPLSGGTLTGSLETQQVVPSQNKQYTLGILTSMYRTVFTKSISCSSAGELNLPEVGGTLARIEDIKQIQVLEFPENAPENSIFQYVGETNNKYTYGYFYTNKGGASGLSPEFVSGSEYVSDPDVMFTKVYSDLGLEAQVGDSFILNVNHGSSSWSNFVQIRLTRDGTNTEKYIPLSTSDEVLSGYGLSFAAETYPEIRYTIISGGGAAWVQINVQDSGGGASLPDQTSNAGKVLTTDGSEASWTDMPGLIIRRL